MVFNVSLGMEVVLWLWLALLVLLVLEAVVGLPPVVAGTVLPTGGGIGSARLRA